MTLIAEPITHNIEVKTATEIPVFNYKQWATITRNAIESAQRDVARLQAEKVQIEQQIRVQLRERQTKIDTEIITLRGVAKKLQRALELVVPAEAGQVKSASIVDATPRAAAPRGKYLATLSLNFAREHDGRFVTEDLYTSLIEREIYRDKRQCQQNFSNYFTDLVRQGELTRLSPGQYQLVSE